MMYRSTILAALAALAAPELASAQVIAIQGAKVITEPGSTLDEATVVMRGGRITAVGKGVAVPAGATVIDGRGKVVTAGMVEAGSDLGLNEVPMERDSRDGSFPSEPDAVYAAYRAADGINPRSVAIPVARTGGVTSAVAAPKGGLVSGTAAWITLADATVPDVIVRAPLAMYATVGANPSTHGSRGMALLKLRELLDDARQYQRRRANYERNQSRPFAASRLDLEALIPVVRGQLPLVVRAHRAGDIRGLLALRRDFGLRLIIQGGTEAWLLGPELAAARVPVVFNPIQNLPGDFDRLHVRDDAAAALRKAGVTIAFSTLDDGANARTIRQLAGNAVARGLAYDDGIAAVTSAPAAIFGITDRGTLKRGQVADVVLWSGDPLELSTRVERVFIGGVEQTLDTRQERLFRRYRTVP